MPRKEPISERALAMLIRSRIANGQDAIAAIRDVLGADMASALRSGMFASLGRRGGKVGGKSTSDAKRAAARLNGAKGGRPRKS